MQIFSKNGIRIMQSDALSALKEVESETVQCCVTSPPYFGLRNYGLPSLIWDSVNGCPHDNWAIEEVKPQSGGKGEASKKQITNGGSQEAQVNAERSTCIECGAWRGSLGLEPTPDLYISHLVQIFREVRRVMKKDGTLWVNIGDSYASSWATSRRSQIGLGSLDDGSRNGGHRPNRLVGDMKEKDLMGIPWLLAFALRDDGWFLRSDIIWAKGNCMPESVTDRPTRSHEYLFLLSKSKSYYYDHNAIKEPAKESSLKRIQQSSFDSQTGGVKDYATTGVDANRSARKTLENFKRARFGGNKHEGYGARIYSGNEDNGSYIENGVNKRDVWNVNAKPFKGAHFATFPPDLITPCILAGSRINDIVLDPFAGSGTVGKVCHDLSRRALLIEPKPEYVEMIKRRV